MYLSCDMGEEFHTTDLGAHWTMLGFKNLQGGTLTSVQFTNEANVLWAIDSNARGNSPNRPTRSIDGGKTWTQLPPSSWEHGPAFWLFADPSNANRLIVGTYSDIYLSTDGGATFTSKFSFGGAGQGGNFLGGAWFDGPRIWVGSRAGFLLSINGGPFVSANVSGIPATEGICSLAAATTNGTTRFCCVTVDERRLKILANPPFAATLYGAFKNLYVLDEGQAAWTPVGANLGGNQFAFVAMPYNDITTAYACGTVANSSQPCLIKTVNGGASWFPSLIVGRNHNVFTGWLGAGGDMGGDWWWGSYPLGLAVSRANPQYVAYCDMGGLVHATTNGGTDWHEIYTSPQNPKDVNTPSRQYYQSTGLEPTAVNWLQWLDPLDLFAGYVDITAVRSKDGGLSWGFDYAGLNLMSNYSTEIFHTVEDPLSHTLYAAQADGAGNLYESNALTDVPLDMVGGRIRFSVDGGANWNTLHDFGHAVVWLALDPRTPNRLYAAVVDSAVGGIYVSSDIQNGAGSTWARLAVPPRTQGHPLNVFAIADGNATTLVCTYSGRLDANHAFTASSGVFVSMDGGQTWLDRSDPGMWYWTKNLVMDPLDPRHNRWYVGVMSAWGSVGGSSGGLYVTADRGQHWKRIFSADSVESSTPSSADAHPMYLACANSGLYYCADRTLAAPSFVPVADYPFSHPTRIFYNPYHATEVWVASFGGGLSVGIEDSPPPALPGAHEMAPRAASEQAPQASMPAVGQNAGGNTATASGGGCFIATAAYGSYLEPHVDALRAFREQYMLTNRPGRWAASVYARWSPPLAHWIAGRPLARWGTRMLLTPLVMLIAYPCTTLVLLLSTVLLIRCFARRKKCGNPV
jgi:photosystem II stability/assembly factor-like uncharacterized protein